MELYQMIALGGSVLLNIVFLVGIRNLNRQNEQYQDYIEEELSKSDSIRNKVERAYERMQDVDIRGSFEADDEVGSAFTELKEIIEELNTTT
tara:strand:+ start:2757 stop:3032 length:276 start_codon:yes stop_codon:yes gene_type:complete